VRSKVKLSLKHSITDFYHTSRLAAAAAGVVRPSAVVVVVVTVN